MMVAVVILRMQKACKKMIHRSFNKTLRATDTSVASSIGYPLSARLAFRFAAFPPTLWHVYDNSVAYVLK